MYDLHGYMPHTVVKRVDPRFLITWEFISFSFFKSI